MDKVKKYFANKKAALNFVGAGPGQRLGSVQEADAKKQAQLQQVQQLQRQQSKDTTPRSPSERSTPAAQAALDRLTKANEDSKLKSTALKNQVKSEMMREGLLPMHSLPSSSSNSNSSKPQESLPSSSTPSLPPNEAKSQLRVFYNCVICSERFPVLEIEQHILACLRESLEIEPLVISAKLMGTSAPDKESFKNCVETIQKYFSNIEQNPSEEKFRKIKLSNKVFQAKVANIEGALTFLKAVGFQELKEAEETFFVLPKELPLPDFGALTEILNDAEPIVGVLDRDIKVYHPSFARKMEPIKIAEDFYEVTVSDVALQYAQRKKEADTEMMLRTKEMREKEKLVNKRVYKYCVLRIRFPDEFVLQGTFFANDTLSTLAMFIQEAMEETLSFSLVRQGQGERLKDDFGATLQSLDLVPSSLLNVVLDTPPSNPSVPLLKPSVISEGSSVPFSE